MLNEIYMVGRSLKRFHVGTEESHPSVKRLGRTDLLIAGIDSTGLITTIEMVDEQHAVTLFKIQESNHSNFPQVNWSAPIWQMDEKSPEVQDWLACSAKDVRKRVELLRRACGSSKITDGQNRLLARMQGFCRELTPR